MSVVERFWRFLEKEPTSLKQILILMTACVLLNILISYAVMLCLTILLNVQVTEIPREKYPISTWQTPIILLGGAWLETLIFCTMPLGAVCNLKRDSKFLITVTAVISSLVFGWLHGGITHLPIQGIAGLTYSFLFLHCGGLKGKFWEPTTITTVTHLWFNCIVILIALVLGATEF